MQDLLLPLITTILITALFVPITIKLAKKYGLVDDPKVRPHPAHIQQRVIPRAGGVPIFLGILVSILIFIPLNTQIIGIITGISILLVLGLLDDKLRDFSPYPRLSLQLVAALIVVALGVGITFITNPIGGILRLDVIQISILGIKDFNLIADLLATVWIVWMMNMVNWSKGVDGQMAGIIFVAGIIIGLVAYKFYAAGDPGQLSVANMSFITAGAAFGFLIFNWYPSKIIPGFSGSNILGFMIAVLCVLTSAKLATALLVLLVPSVDFFYTFFRRIFSGKNPFKGDQKHLHHLLLKRGWTHQGISLFYIFSCAILGLLAANLSSQGKLFTVAGLAVVIIGGLLWLNFFGRSLEKPGPDNG